MTDHLPECVIPQVDYPCRQCWEIECECTCICERLRACEQRVTHKEFLLDEGDPYREVYRAGFRDALDAAREAVERVSSLLQPLGPALAAIDALKEDK